MSFWSWLLNGSPSGITPNANPSSTPPTVGGGDYSPGDPHGVELEEGSESFSRALPFPVPSPWDGWPAEWAMPKWDMGSRLNELVDVAWACLDLNASVLSAMPVYRTRHGEVIEPSSWMQNPDPTIYTSWHEFAKQLFWDYQLGEAFVLPVARGFDDYPLTFRVIPPWMVHVELKGGVRRYNLGGQHGPDVTDEVLHIRYKSTTDGAHGVGPLEAAGGRMLTAGVLARYVREVVSTGGVPAYTLETDQELDDQEAQDVLNQWVANRAASLGAPPLLDNNVTLKTHQSMSPRDMAMLEITEFNEARIAVLLGVPPYLVGLSAATSSTPYTNVSQLFDFHDRSSIKPKATNVMTALSNWALPRGTNAELNRDEYTRPAFEVRATSYVQLVAAGIMTVDEVRTAERLSGPAPALAFTGDTVAPPNESVTA